MIRRLAVLAVLSSLATAACAAPSSSDDESASTSEAALSQVRLEKSRIEVFLDQTNVATSSGECSIQSTHFRITYVNPTLPAGTKVALHGGETSSEQQYIGDGFGWGTWFRHDWTNVRDLPMTASGGTWSAETTASPYGRMYQDWSSGWGDWRGEQYPAQIQFVFRLVLPDGTVLWDNRLRQDYWVSGNPAACPSGTTGGFVFRQGWGPF